MQKFKFQRKFPKTAVILGLLLMILGIAFVGVLYPPFGAFLIGSALIVANLTISFAFWLVTSIQLWVGLGIVGLLGALIVYRRQYGKKTGYAQLPQTVQPNLQGGLLNTQSLQPAPTPQTIIVPEKTEVASA